jgi:hypothetical protein
MWDACPGGAPISFDILIYGVRANKGTPREMGLGNFFPSPASGDATHVWMSAINSRLRRVRMQKNVERDRACRAAGIRHLPTHPPKAASSGAN